MWHLAGFVLWVWSLGRSRERVGAGGWVVRLGCAVGLCGGIGGGVGAVGVCGGIGELRLDEKTGAKILVGKFTRFARFRNFGDF